MDYTFRKLTPSILKATTDEWLKQVDSDDVDFNTNGYYQFLESAAAIENKTALFPDSYCYAVLNSDASDVAHAMYSITVPHEGKPMAYIKVLDIRTAPEYDLRMPGVDGSEKMARRSAITKLIPFGLIGVLQAAFSTHKVKSVKIFGNKQVDIDIFTKLKDLLSEGGDLDVTELGFDLCREGAWLKITSI